MHVNETGHAQRLNMLKERPRKWFFREEVDFLASLAFVVNCGHTIDLQQVQAKRFSFTFLLLSVLIHFHKQLCSFMFEILSPRARVVVVQKSERERVRVRETGKVTAEW